MIAEILSTGDEVCSGAVIDSNAAFIADHLARAGVRVARHTCVGDDLKEICDAVSQIAGRADIVVATGGLGPTMDDLTSEAVAMAAGAPLVEDQKALESIKAIFTRFSKSMTESDAKQAMLPKGARPIINDAGTAPGFLLKISKCSFFFLPGVPREMERMLIRSVIPMIESECLSDFSRQVSMQRIFSLFGIPEAEVNGRIKDLENKFKGIKIGMIARFPVIYVKLTGSGEDERATNQALEESGRAVLERLGKWIFSEKGETMEAVVGRLLRKSGATLGVAESCTGGLIADRVTNIAGSSDYFLFSAVTYANSAKTGILGVDPGIIEKYGAVSEETTRAMASGVLSICNADFGIAVSGIAGPGGGSDDKPVGTLCVGLATSEKTISKKFWFPFPARLANKRIFSETALDMLRRELLHSDPGN
ncbi:MAG: competence/damage-inducible protein A [Deltaproteobacteria bacterium]|nr:competence/damage-inducible protein A [Deltaproteobacteria bacterium]